MSALPANKQVAPEQKKQAIQKAHNNGTQQEKAGKHQSDKI